MLTGKVRMVICEFRDDADPRVLVKYELQDTDLPAIDFNAGGLPERELTDPAQLAAITALAASLTPATSALLGGIPLTVPGPAGDPPEE